LVCTFPHHTHFKDRIEEQHLDMILSIICSTGSFQEAAVEHSEHMDVASHNRRH